RDAERDVTLDTQRLDLSREHVCVPVIVAYGGDDAGIGGGGGGRPRPSPPLQKSREVGGGGVGLRGAGPRSAFPKIPPPPHPAARRLHPSYPPPPPPGGRAGECPAAR